MQFFHILLFLVTHFHAAVFYVKLFACCIHLFHVSLFLCFTFSCLFFFMLPYFQVAHFQVALISCCALFRLHLFFMLHFFQFYFYSIPVAFLGCILFVLNSFPFTFFSSCIYSMWRYCISFMMHFIFVALFSDCTFFCFFFQKLLLTKSRLGCKLKNYYLRKKILLLGIKFPAQRVKISSNETTLNHQSWKHSKIIG